MQHTGHACVHHWLLLDPLLRRGLSGCAAHNAVLYRVVPVHVSPTIIVCYVGHMAISPRASCVSCVQALERFIPDIKQRTELCMIGTPITHERFLRRHRGSYGEQHVQCCGSISGSDQRVCSIPSGYTCVTALWGAWLNACLCYSRVVHSNCSEGTLAPVRE